MKPIISLVFLLLSLQGFASHIVGGEMTYEYIGPGLNPNTRQYKITLKLFRDELSGGASMPVNVYLGIFDGTQQYPMANQGFVVNKTREDTVLVNPFPACVVNAAPISYHVGIYELNVDLPDNVNGYTVSFQTCCRVMPLENVDAASAAGTGSTYTCTIPPVIDNSAVFSTVVDLICRNKPFTLDFSATDPDSDSLVYSFCNAYDGGLAVGSGLINPEPPPYNSVPYFNGYSAGEPLGSAVKIDSTTGIISGIAPMVGRYLIGVCVKSYRNGVLIGEHRKDFIVKIGDCDFASALLLPQPVTCNGFNVNFINGNQSPLNQDYFWDFGVPSLTDDTSNLPNPTFTYPDTGRYVYKLVVNRNQPCGDSTTQTIDIYPGFYPGFSWNGQCANSQIQFTDTTNSNFGMINSWHWNFGNASSTDTSILQNPIFTFPDPGIRTVTLIVGNTNGCVDSVSFPVDIVAKPVISNLFNDTTYCGKDTIQLHASAPAGGTYSWSPASNIQNENTADPLVFPTAATEYVLSFDLAGCVATDTVRLNPAIDLTTSIAVSSNDICEEDTVALTASANHSPSTFTWGQVLSLSSSSGPVTNAFPVDTTVYSLFAVWGKNCFDTSTISINVKKLAIPDAGIDTSFCVSSGGVMLNASGGDDYVWSPVLGLSDPNIYNPIANPQIPTIYKVSVGVTGCVTRRVDSVLVTPILAAQISLFFNDTTYCGKDTIQLHASTPVGGTYSWSPALNILNENTADPLVFPAAATEYVLSFDLAGCITTDTVRLNPAMDFTTSISVSSNDICEEDTIVLTASANHSLSTFTWDPALSLSSSTGPITNAFPLDTMVYSLYSVWGKNCFDTSTISINVKKLALADAGTDTAFCVSSGGVMLNASGGDDYVWSPALGLSSPNIYNPVANPQMPTVYKVSVGITGCGSRRVDSIIVTPLAPAVSPLNDTLICSFDTLQLSVTSPTAVSYFWTPDYNIDNQNSNSIRVNPDIPTRYYVEVRDVKNCIARDSVFVDVQDLVLNVSKDTTICQGDAVTLQALGNALQYNWSPASGLDNDLSATPVATPVTTTTYHVIGSIGKCQLTDSVTINVAPYPTANAGADTAICFGNAAQLNATGGSKYIWSPASGLSDNMISNPVANPASSATYTVSISDTLGCPKTVTDDVVINVFPTVTADAGRDTSIFKNQPFQLNGSGGTSYLWTPATGLSNAFIDNPVATLTNSQRYVLEVSNSGGCMDTDTINITVNSIPVGMYIPNAFSPNGDNVNDVFKGVFVGIKSLDYFNVYNRFGELVFSSKRLSDGWDGSLNGNPQSVGVYVWTIEAIDLQDKKIFKKGIVTLIR